MINIYKSKIGDLADTFLQTVEIRDRRYRLRTLKSSFVGEEAVTAIVDAGLVKTRSEVVAVGHRLQKELQLFSQSNGRPFKDDKLLYTVNYGNMTLGSWNHVEKKLLKQNAYMFLQLVQLEDRFHFLRKCKDCFVGADIVSSMVYSGLVKSRLEAVQLGRVLETKMKLFQGKHEFNDDQSFYQLTSKGQKMMQKALKKAAKSKRKKGGPESDFQRDAIQQRIAKRLEMDYSNRFLANVGEVNKEMQELTKGMYTGHHEIVVGGEQTKRTKPKRTKKKSVEIEKVVPASITVQRQKDVRASTYSYGRLSSIYEGAVMMDTSFPESLSDLDGYRYSLMEEERPNTRRSTVTDIYIEDDVLMKEEEEDDEYEEVTVTTEDDSWGTLEDTRESSQEYSIRDMVERDLWSDDVNAVHKALKDLLILCDPGNGTENPFYVLELDGILAVLHVMEKYSEENASISFLSSALLERLYLATTVNAGKAQYSPDQFTNDLFEMGAVPILLGMMKREHHRNVQAYQATRWLINILYEDPSCS